MAIFNLYYKLLARNNTLDVVVRGVGYGPSTKEVAVAIASK